MATETKTFYPQAHTDFSGYQISNAANPVGQGSNNTTKGASICAAKSSTAKCYWPFDVSAIPEKATIDSVSCVAAVKADTSVFSFSANVRLYSGSTAKGFAVSLANNNNIQKITVSDGIWTRAELGAIRLRTYFQNKGPFALALVFYGADLTVTYTYQSEKFMLKLGGAWHDIARVFKKVSGIWVEQTDLANVIEDGVRYQNGGEYVSPVYKRTVTITGTGDATASYVTINGTKYTSAETVQVDDGDVVQATVAGGGFGSTPSISVNGTQKVSSAGTYNHTVTSDCTVNLKVTNEGFGNYGIITITTGGGESTPTLISFTIDGTSYQAEEGMTWEQWVASSYNTGGFKVSSNYGNYYIAASTGVYLKNPEGYILLSTAVIISGGAYTLN